MACLYGFWCLLYPRIPLLFPKIRSIVVQTKPQNTTEVIKVFNSSDFCEYHLHDEKGRIIVTVEGAGVEEEILKLKKIQAIDHVISAEMMYSYSEDELDELKDKVEKDNSVPEWLNDENVKAEDIQYKGDLKKRF